MCVCAQENIPYGTCEKREEAKTGFETHENAKLTA